MTEDTGTIRRVGPWRVAVRATGVMCPDGKRRTIALVGEPDTFFSIRGRVQVKRKTVTGVVMHRGADTDEGLDLAFTPTGKNAGIFDEGKGA